MRNKGTSRFSAYLIRELLSTNTGVKKYFKRAEGVIAYGTY